MQTTGLIQQAPRPAEGLDGKIVRRRARSVVVITVLVMAWLGDPASAQSVPEEEREAGFARSVAPFLKMHCTGCHGGSDPEAKIALDRFHDSARVQEEYALWQKVLAMLEERRMPPEGEPMPTDEEYAAVVGGIQAELAAFDCSGQRSTGRVTLRRLNRVAYNNTIRDLLGIDFQPAKDFPADDVGNGFDSMGDVLTLPPILLEKYLAAAETIVDGVWADEAARKRILAVEPSDDTDITEAARRNLTQFATRAFRRPLEEEEVNRLLALMKRAREQNFTEAEAYRTAIQAVLVSPHFLFRVELDRPCDGGNGHCPLNDYEVATRLSYFLWNSMPDETLFELASQGTLKQPDVLAQQVRRMLQDAKAVSLVKDFAGQWLQLRDLPAMTPDPGRFPNFDEELRHAMQRETELFIETMIREDRSVLEFLDADFSYVNERLARHYGLQGVEGPEFRRAGLPPGRRGVLTHGSILLLTSNPTRTSPVKRGKWVLDNILGEPPAPPPPNVPELEEGEELVGSLRERMEQHRTNPACAVCHEKMDTLGFGLENFDAIGAWRERDGRFPIDASGTLPGADHFSGPEELMEILRREKKGDFCRSLASKMLTYALGRGLTTQDRCTVDTLVEELASNDYRISALVVAIAQSDPFLSRESKGGD